MPLTHRVMMFLLKTHYKQIVASRTMRDVLDRLRVHIKAAEQRQKDEMGYNLAGLRYIKMTVEERKTRNFVDEEEFKEAEERGKKKRGFASLA